MGFPAFQNPGSFCRFFIVGPVSAFPAKEARCEREAELKRAADQMRVLLRERDNARKKVKKLGGLGKGFSKKNQSKTDNCK